MTSISVLIMLAIAIFKIISGLKEFNSNQDDIDNSKIEGLGLSGNNTELESYSQNNANLPIYTDEHFDLIHFGLNNIVKAFKKDQQFTTTLIFKNKIKTETIFFPTYSKEEDYIEELEILLNKENPEIAVFYTNGIYENTNVVYIRIYNQTNFYVCKFIKNYWDLFIETEYKEDIFMVDMSEINPIFDGSTISN